VSASVSVSALTHAWRNAPSGIADDYGAPLAVST